MLNKFCASQIPDLAKATFEVALRRHKASIFDEAATYELRKAWFDILPDPRQAAVLEDDQPFYLHALAQSLRLIGDPDVDVLEKDGYSNYASGVHLGHLKPLGPTPQVFRPKIKETSYDDSGWLLEMDNYFRGSEDEADRILTQQVEEEELAGRMKAISGAEARRLYPGSSLRVAAQGILEKPDGAYKIVQRWGPRRAPEQ